MTTAKKPNESMKPNDAIELNGGLSWMKLIVFAVLIFTSSFSTIVVRDTVLDPRPFPFTSKDAQILEMTLRRDHEKAVEKLKDNMPPEATRSRLRAVEKWVQSQDNMFTPPTEKWAD